MMAESNDTGAPDLGGNETEIALGSATSMATCAGRVTIGDLSKIDVYGSRGTQSQARRREDSGRTRSTSSVSGTCANQVDPFDYWVVAPVVGELVERRTSPAALVRLFEQHTLDPARFVPDPDGRTVYDKHSTATFSAVVYDCFRRLRRSVYKRLQGPPIVVDEAPSVDRARHHMVGLDRSNPFRGSTRPEDQKKFIRGQTGLNLSRRDHRWGRRDHIRAQDRRARRDRPFRDAAVVRTSLKARIAGTGRQPSLPCLPPRALLSGPNSS